MGMSTMGMGMGMGMGSDTSLGQHQQLSTSTSHSPAPSPRASMTAVQSADDMASKVNPMRSDFHFYAAEHKTQEMASISTGTNTNTDTDTDTVTGNTNPIIAITDLNERLMQMWEKENSSTRSEYLTKEELDRARFMNEDEIESRHCATLTSRSKPLVVHQHQHLKPQRVAKVVTLDGGDQHGDDHGDHHHDEDDVDEEEEEEDYEDEDKIARYKRHGDGDGDGDEEQTEEEETYESPAKKMKEGEAAIAIEEADKHASQDSPNFTI